MLAWMYSTSELDELFQILNSVKGFKLNNHKGATQQYQTAKNLTTCKKFFYHHGIEKINAPSHN